jgi:hypothetical protein
MVVGVMLLTSGASYGADPGSGDDASRWRLDGALSLSRFEQQIKTEIGGERGERLVEAVEIGFQAITTYRVWGPLSVGAFLRYDTGTRNAARFSRILDNRTVTDEGVGGAYDELWVGPLIRAQWRGLFAEFGYGAVGLRNDDARVDLPDTEGDTKAALRTSSTVAYLLNLGGVLALTETLDLALRLEYRVRYYDRRDHPLVDTLVHGTQNYTPFIGVSWAPDR